MICLTGILAGVPFMGLVGFILGPVLVALVVTGFRIYAGEFDTPAPPARLE